MSEIASLLNFMKTGRRKEISLTEYIHIQEKKGTWSKKRGVALRRELSLTDEFEISYVRKKIDDQLSLTETIVKYPPDILMVKK